MQDFLEQIRSFSEQYKSIKLHPERNTEKALPSRNFFIDDDNVLSLPRSDGDGRYPLGNAGFNFWVYSSGYMHGNEGLFSYFLKATEGQEPKIAFFAGFSKGTDEYVRIPLLSVPVIDDEIGLNVERYTVFSFNAVYYITELPGLRFAVRVFVDIQNKICFSVSAENLGSDVQKIYLSHFFNPFLSNDVFESSEARWFKESMYDPSLTGSSMGTFLFKVNEDIDRVTSVSNFGVLKRVLTCENENQLVSHEETTSRYQYVGGSRDSLNNPASLKKGSFGNPRHRTTFTEVAIAGDLIHLNLVKNKRVRLDMEFSTSRHCRDDNEVNTLLRGEITPLQMDMNLQKLQEKEVESEKRLSVIVGRETEGLVKYKVLNSFFRHLKKQVEFSSLIKGYVQLSAGSLIGIRDIFQAMEAYLFYNPEAVKEKMIEAFQYMAPNGRCPRQYALPKNPSEPPAMDLRPFIDQGVWVISTVVTYLRFTGDFDFLRKECGYHEIVDEKAKKVKKSSLSDSVLDHMFKIMDYLISNIDNETKCLHALYGDWNDALDGLGVSLNPEKEYGTGVSVMASLQFFQNLDEMIELLSKIDKVGYADKINVYSKIKKELEEGLFKWAVVKNAEGQKRILHGWGDQRSFLVGSFDDPDRKSRHSLTSNAFWVLSGIYDKAISLRPVILEAFRGLDSKYGLMTFTPHFEKDVKKFGRIPKLPPGTAENGAAYVHASIFGIMALFRMGCPRQAWEQLYKSLPFTHDMVSCSPFVMPNSYGFNKDMNIDGESMHDWQTGSANVVLKTLIRYVFGIDPKMEGFWVQPASWIPFESFQFNIRIRACDVKINYRNNRKGKRQFNIDGIVQENIRDHIMDLEKVWVPYASLKSTVMEIGIED